MDTQVADKTWQELAGSLGVDVAALKAVATVEANGSGFLKDPPQRPKVLFEGHAFHRLTGGRFAAQAPNLSYPKWDKTKYSGSLIGEWARLDVACQLDRPAALQSASWGMFQIMGFNYAYCGCPDVETFVAQHHAGADGQVACFARFVARPKFLDALRDKKWADFAAAYNGPQHAKNNYAGKLAAAYATFAKAGRRKPGRRRRAVERETKELPPGRAVFAPVQASRRANARRRNVRPDSVDLRDWEYHPSIAVSPAQELLPQAGAVVKYQGDTSACTGFALSAVIEHLLTRAERPREEISAFMLYSMARRYDEWAEDETEDSGSSLRGALKGWSRHGASRASLWHKLEMPRATNDPSKDWWLDAVRRPMGAYYRIDPKNVRDMHVALNEVGAIYASALTHHGWDAVPTKRGSPAKNPRALPVIESRRGAADQGHAFAIVGYMRQGFIVQNSWGPDWGLGGYAVLPYEDWVRNAMDSWVVQLGVVTVEHEAVAKAPSLRFDKTAGRALVSNDQTLADHEISPFVIDMENEGRLSERGQFRTTDDDLRALLENHVPAAQKQWGVDKKQPLDVAIYAHGGLTDEEAAATTARDWIAHLYSNQIFPIFLMWETGARKTLANIYEDATRGDAELARAGGRFKERFSEWKNERLEGLARWPGGKLWGEMKENAAALSRGKDAGIVKLFDRFRELRMKLPPVRLHLIGHSAGAIVHTHLGARALEKDLAIASISLLAPAVRLDVFNEKLGGAIAGAKIPLLLANLTDAAERNDDTCKPYGHSLLYLVSRSFEDRDETPLLGMERHLVPALATERWGAHVRQLPCPGGMWESGVAATRATTHGGIDDDTAVREAVVRFVRSVVR